MLASREAASGATRFLPGEETIFLPAGESKYFYSISTSRRNQIFLPDFYQEEKPDFYQEEEKHFWQEEKDFYQVGEETKPNIIPV